LIEEELMLGNFFFDAPLFFDLFEKHAALVLTASQELYQGAIQNPIGSLKKIKLLEHEADAIVQQCISSLYKTFLTPIDRDQIYRLIGCLDDIIDGIDEVADCLQIYKLHKSTPPLIELAKILLDASQEVQKGMKGLRCLKDSEQLRNITASIRQHESSADKALYSALEELFDKETDARQIIKWKEVYEKLENTSDRCADVADVIECILLEND
jgi:uncharacterized protein